MIFLHVLFGWGLGTDSPHEQRGEIKSTGKGAGSRASGHQSMTAPSPCQEHGRINTERNKGETMQGGDGHLLIYSCSWYFPIGRINPSWQQDRGCAQCLPTGAEGTQISPAQSYTMIVMSLKAWKRNSASLWKRCSYIPRDLHPSCSQYWCEE